MQKLLKEIKKKINSESWDSYSSSLEDLETKLREEKLSHNNYTECEQTLDLN